MEILTKYGRRLPSRLVIISLKCNLRNGWWLPSRLIAVYSTWMYVKLDDYVHTYKKSIFFKRTSPWHQCNQVFALKSCSHVILYFCHDVNSFSTFNFFPPFAKWLLHGWRILLLVYQNFDGKHKIQRVNGCPYLPQGKLLQVRYIVNGYCNTYIWCLTLKGDFQVARLVTITLTCLSETKITSKEIESPQHLLA